MKLPTDIPVYGDPAFRGDCPKESVEQVTFFRELRKRYPDTLGILALHPKNEEKRTGKQFNQLAMDKAMGLSPGASDIVIPGSPAFVCEMKRKDHTKSSWQSGQQEYLRAAQSQGVFACVALGWEAAMQAVEEWLKTHG